MNDIPKVLKVRFSLNWNLGRLIQFLGSELVDLVCGRFTYKYCKFMNVQEDFQYCVMQDGALNKSDKSYLFGLFFLTENIGNNVGLCWVCRISII